MVTFKMYLHNIKLWTAVLLAVMPVTVFAGRAFGVTELFNDSVVIALIATFSLMGGIAATGIHTDADEFVSNPKIYKVFIGFWIGLGFGLGIYFKYSIGVYILLAPVFIAASLGSAILVFYMRWFADPKTRRKFRVKIEQKLGLEDK